MPSPNEILQMINRQFGITQQQVIEEVNELIKTIDDDPKKFTYELSKELEQYCERIGLCPLCGSKVIRLGLDFEPSEYFGQPVNEEIVRYGCESSNCGYIKE